MGDPVELAINRAIDDHGPISFAEYMDLALYSPGGFYDWPPVGPRGHFVTGPHTHEVFGQLLSSAIRRQWEQLGRPSPYPLIEIGAGDGTLATQLLEHLRDLPIDYTAVERSAGARERLSALDRVRVAEHLDELPPIRDGAVVANELLDNLPFHRVRMLADGPAELRVGLSGGGLRAIEVPCEAELRRLVPPGMEPGDEATISVAAVEMVDRLARRLERGSAILIDYGTSGSGSGGEVHGYRNQRVIEDVLDDPGSADITAGVDFGALTARAEARGLRVDGIPSQRAALQALGFEEWVRAELERQGELIRNRAGMEAVRTWGGRSRATLLVDPGALGRLRWLVVSAPETPRPDWIPNGERTPDPDLLE